MVTRINTGHRIVECEIVTVKGRMYAKALRDVGAAKRILPAIAVAPTRTRVRYFSVNEIALKNRSGEAAETVLSGR